MAAVGGDAVDGALVTLQLPQSRERVAVPQLEHPASAAAEQSRRPGDDAQRTNPVTVGARHLLSDRGIIKSIKKSFPQCFLNVNVSHGCSAYDRTYNQKPATFIPIKLIKITCVLRDPPGGKMNQNWFRNCHN